MNVQFVKMFFCKNCGANRQFVIGTNEWGEYIIYCDQCHAGDSLPTIDEMTELKY